MHMYLGEQSAPKRGVYILYNHRWAIKLRCNLDNFPTCPMAMAVIHRHTETEQRIHCAVQSADDNYTFPFHVYFKLILR